MRKKVLPVTQLCNDSKTLEYLELFKTLGIDLHKTDFYQIQTNTALDRLMLFIYDEYLLVDFYDPISIVESAEFAKFYVNICYKGKKRKDNSLTHKLKKYIISKISKRDGYTLDEIYLELLQNYSNLEID